MLILRTEADLSLSSARTYLAHSPRREPMLPTLAAAALAALSALALAGAVILGPPGGEMIHAPAVSSSHPG